MAEKFASSSHPSFMSSSGFLILANTTRPSSLGEASQMFIVARNFDNFNLAPFFDSAPLYTFMSLTFREFVNRRPFSVKLREEEAAPSMGGAPPSPDNPDTKTNKYHFDSLQRGLGMDQDGIDAALTG